MKYDLVNKVNAIKKLERVSTPGLRKYTGYKEMPRVLNGLGIAVLSTSKGVMTDKEARDLKIGGEVLCYVYELGGKKNVKNRKITNSCTGRCYGYH